MSTPKIIIHVEGGLVQKVYGVGLPCKVAVEVRDYDVESRLSTPEVDKDGREYIPSTWKV